MSWGVTMATVATVGMVVAGTVRLLGWRSDVVG
jgi:hypothetical protein